MQFAHDELRKDLRIVEAAVARTGDALQFAAEDLWEKCDGDEEKKKKYRQIVTKAVMQDGTACQYACEWLRSERDFIHDLVQETKADWLLNYVAQDLATQSDFKRFQTECKKVAGKGLVFTYYNSFGCFARPETQSWLKHRCERGKGFVLHYVSMWYIIFYNSMYK